MLIPKNVNFIFGTYIPDNHCILPVETNDNTRATKTVFNIKRIFNISYNEMPRKEMSRRGHVLKSLRIINIFLVHT